MERERKRAAVGSLWGDLNESARVARELAEEARKAREAKTSRLRAMRLERAAQAHEVRKEINKTSSVIRI